MIKGKTKIKYGTATISADSMLIDFKRNQAVAYGRVMMQDMDQLILGNSAYYDIETETGIIFDGASKFELGFYYGDEMRKVGEYVYDADYGRFTTCDGKHPHFHFEAHTMRIYQEHMFVGRPFILHIHDMPVFIIPYGAFSLKSGRKSGFLMPEPGINNGDGKYFRNMAYFLVINDYQDATFSVDLMEKTGYNYRVNYYYLDRYKYRGSLDATYTNRVFSPESSRDDWAVYYRHFQNLPEKATFDATLDFASSRQVWENETDINKRLQERITSSISYRKPFANSSFYASSNYTDDLINKTKNIVLPSFSFSMPSKPVHEFLTFIPDEVRKENHWWKDFSFSWSSSGSHTGFITDKSPTFGQVIYDNVKDDNDRYVSEHHAAVRQNASLSWNSTFWGWLKLGNTFYFQDALMDRDRNGKQLVYGYNYSTNSTMGLTLYGMLLTPTLPVTATRHIVTPSASFRYSPDFYEQNKDFYGIGSLSSSRKARSVNMSLEQKWQFRLRADENGQERKLNDIFVLRSSVSYDLERKVSKWSDINHTFNVNPGSFNNKSLNFSMNQSYSATQKPYEKFDISSWRVSSGVSVSGNASYNDYFPVTQNDFITGKYFEPDSLTITDSQVRTIQDLERLAKPGNWSLNSSHDYGYDKRNKYKSQNLRNSLNIKLTTNWSVSYSNYYDLEKKILMSQSMSVNRELHCWRILFTYTQSANFWDLRLVLFDIKLPETLKLQHQDYSR
jgi:lipopolysaccharide assembly outer membrane protein LptD (OstA)